MDSSLTENAMLGRQTKENIEQNFTTLTIKIRKVFLKK